MTVVHYKNPIPPHLLDSECPRIDRVRLAQPKLLRRQLMTKALFTPKKPVTEIQQVKRELEQKGFTVVKDGETLRANASSVQGNKTPGTQLKVTKTSAALLGVFGASKGGHEIDVTNKNGDQLRSLGEANRSGQATELLNKSAIKPSNSITDSTHSKSKDPINEAKVRRRLEQYGIDID